MQKNVLERLCDDTGLIYSIICSGRVIYSDDVSFVYRQREKSIMHEAKIVESYLLELLLFQDCINHGKLKFFCFARFFKPYIYLYKHRIDFMQYKKYISTSRKAPNDFIGEQIDSSNNFKLKINLLKFSFCWIVVRAYKKIFVFYIARFLVDMCGTEKLILENKQGKEKQDSISHLLG